MANATPAPRDHYQEVTAAILTALEKGTPPWRRPWDSSRVASSGPVNISGRRYHGINTLLLSMSPLALCSNDPRWATYKQAQAAGAQVRKGERATTIFFYKTIEVDDDGRGGGRVDDDGKLRVPVLRSYPVFHAGQIDNLPLYRPRTIEEAPWQSPDSVAVILQNSRANVREGGDRAFYSPLTDSIQLPPRSSFRSAADWSATAMHELGHWSGAKSRLDRDLTGRFGSSAYAAEELRAEIASAFIGAELNLPSDIANHASYISSWVSVLRNDKREIFRAAADAMRISDYCLSFHPEFKNQIEAERDDETGAHDVHGKSDGLPGFVPPATQTTGLRQTALRNCIAGPIQIASALPSHIKQSLGKHVQQPETPQNYSQEDYTWTPPSI
ncbi:MAG: zincin-like metallopeptidase domain-containing protein [Rhodospirillaceae bacterium]